MFKFKALGPVLTSLCLILLSISSTAQIDNSNDSRNAKRGPSCAKALQRRGPIDRSTSDVYYVTSGPFYAVGSLNRNGLALDLKTRNIKSGRRSRILSGKDQFQKILNYFEGQFAFISGVWFEGDNIATFNRLTGAGVSVEEAALQTWTGQQAKAAGYTEPKVHRLYGKTGRYIIVEIDFYKKDNL